MEFNFEVLKPSFEVLKLLCSETATKTQKNLNRKTQKTLTVVDQLSREWLERVRQGVRGHRGVDEVDAGRGYGAGIDPALGELIVGICAGTAVEETEDVHDRL